MTDTNSDLQNLLLEKRGIRTAEEKEKFLHPDYARDFYDPLLMHDMERAVVRFFESIEAKEKIVIYADYDCDGIPGAVIMHDLLKKIGYENFSVYIPDRHDEGYGLHADAAEQFIKDGVNLLFTIDLGITAVAEVANLEAGGVNVIVTDHHLPLLRQGYAGQGFDLPKAFAVVNPKLPARNASQDSDAGGGSYPDPMLCGAGVAFKFAQAFLSKYGEFYKVTNGWEKWLLDMAGLATLSDMVPLINENRAIAHFGMKVLRKSPRPGLVELLGKLNIDQRYLTEDDIGFMIAPRLNAASRMDSPMRAFELLSEKDPARARDLAEHLSKINDERKILVAQYMKEAYKTLEKRELRDVIVVGNPAWKAGVLGLVAGKLCDKYKKPTFVWGHENGDDGVLKGSCRSVLGVNIVEMMGAVSGSLVAYGGHAAAGGFSVSRGEVHFLEEKLCGVFGQKASAENAASVSVIETDAALALSDVSMKNYEIIERLAPYGVGNPKPIFLFENVLVKEVKLFGKEKNHLELTLAKDGAEKKAIAFFSAPDSFSREVASGATANILASFDLSYFGGRKTLRLRIIDII